MRRAGRLPLVLLTGLTFTVYFCHHAVNGRHGFEAKKHLIERSNIVEQEIGRLEAVRAKLQRDVTLLNSERPHPDMIELIAADVLGFVRADAIVIAPAQR